MQYYFAQKYRSSIETTWLDEMIFKHDTNNVSGPYNNIITPITMFFNAGQFIDDEDFAVFVKDNKYRWWRIVPYKDGTCYYREMKYYPACLDDPVWMICEIDSIERALAET